MLVDDCFGEAGGVEAALFDLVSDHLLHVREVLEDEAQDVFLDDVPDHRGRGRLVERDELFDDLERLQDRPAFPDVVDGFVDHLHVFGCLRGVLDETDELRDGFFEHFSVGDFFVDADLPEDPDDSVLGEARLL